MEIYAKTPAIDYAGLLHYIQHLHPPPSLPTRVYHLHSTVLEQLFPYLSNLTLSDSQLRFVPTNLLHHVTGIHAFILSEDSIECLKHCSQLKVIDVEQFARQRDRQGRLRIHEALAGLPHLTTLLSDFPFQISTKQLETEILDDTILARLEEFTLPRDGWHLLQKMPKLTRIRIKEDCLSNTGAEREPLPPRIQQLTFSYASLQAVFQLTAPGLRKLEVHPPEYLPQFMEGFFRRFPRLIELRIHHHFFRYPYRFLLIWIGLLGRIGVTRTYLPTKLWIRTTRDHWVKQMIQSEIHFNTVRVRHFDSKVYPRDLLYS